MKASILKLFAALGLTAICGGVVCFAIKQTGKKNPEMVGQVSISAIGVVGKLAGTGISIL